MSRQYNKTSPYWNARKNDSLPQNITAQMPNVEMAHMPDLQLEMFGENLMASCAGTGSTTNTRLKGINGLDKNGLGGYENLMSYPLPYEVNNGRISMGTAIQLVMRAYTGFAVFRNAIEVLVEFTNTPMHVKGGNAKSRSFVKAWFEKVGMDKLKEQFFREYYRSGNVFLYRFDGRLRESDFNSMKQVMGTKSNVIPIRYVVINPTNVFVENGVVTNRFTYVKLLSAFESQRLKTPQTPEEQEMYDSLPDYVKIQIKNSSGISLNNIYIPIDPYRLYYIFYKKQDYEPLATPMGFGVLNDIEWKLQLKRMDMALTKTIEHAMLLVTNGNEPEKGGINPNNIKMMQEIFKNPTIGRVLVADYTTKAEWIIPDFKELLGPEKYTTVDKDIREGLQSILIGEDKFANAIMKARVFNERLKEGRMAFKRDFLDAEIKRVCIEMNFKAIPTVEFEEVSLEDDTNLHRLYTQWAQLGLLSPWELTRAKQTGLLPDKDENIEAQGEYKTLRENEFYYPLIGASIPAHIANTPVPVPTATGGVKTFPRPSQSPSGGGAAGRPAGTKGPQTTKKMSPIGGGISTKGLMQAVDACNALKVLTEEGFKTLLKADKLEQPHQELAETIAKTIMVNEDINNWTKETVKAYIDSPKEMDKTESDNIDEIRILSDVTELQAILINKSKINHE